MNKFDVAIIKLCIMLILIWAFFAGTETNKHDGTIKNEIEFSH